MYDVYFDQYSVPKSVDADFIKEVIPGSYSFFKLDGHEAEGGEFVAMIPMERVCMIIKVK
ncbi:hypothetical protein M0R72_17185 [Candidatus Pacearchaeota archaeon]|jgi:hypothetical protein|nr:hypothetical protein [Candidatus Pacearchaeota archaeon]